MRRVLRAQVLAQTLLLVLVLVWGQALRWWVASLEEVLIEAVAIEGLMSKLLER
jgi:hypothetical protein